MHLARLTVANEPRRFGRGPRRALETARATNAINPDLKLFATTFIAGFVFVSILLA